MISGELYSSLTCSKIHETIGGVGRSCVSAITIACKKPAEGQACPRHLQRLSGYDDSKALLGLHQKPGAKLHTMRQPPNILLAFMPPPYEISAIISSISAVIASM